MQAKDRKLCAKCLKLKPPKQFSSHQNRGRWCKKCYSEYFKEYNKKRYASLEARAVELQRAHKKYANVVRPQRMERKKKLILLMGGKCNLCGYNKSAAALDFDHLEAEGNKTPGRDSPNPTKRRTLSHLLAQQRPGAFELAIAEAKRCQLICANCHREQSFPGHEL
jgi:hypothetical protein